MALAHFIMLIHELLNKYLYIVPYESPLIILDSKYDVCIANNGKDTKHTMNIYRRVHFLRNGEKYKCTILYGVREVFNWHKLQLRILVIMI